MTNTRADADPQIEAAATHVAAALGITPAELAAIAGELAADAGQDRPAADMLMLALAEAVRRAPQRRDLVDAVGVAEMLGVSRARVHQLADPETGHRDFPRPRYHLAAGKVWARGDIAAFDLLWERRRTGRPRKAS